MHLVYEIRQEVDHHLFPDTSFNFDFIFFACLLGKFNNQLVHFFVHAAKKINGRYSGSCLILIPASVGHRITRINVDNVRFCKPWMWWNYTGYIKTLHFLFFCNFTFLNVQSCFCYNNAALMVWLGLGRGITWLGLGEDHVLARAVQLPQTRLGMSLKILRFWLEITPNAPNYKCWNAASFSGLSWKIFSGFTVTCWN